MKERGYEPVYKLFFFCPKSSCVEQGTKRMEAQGVKFPKFENKLGTKKNTQPVEVASESFQVLNGEEFLQEENYQMKE